MAEKDRIELNIQLPENALEQLSHLAEQLQGILKTVVSAAAPAQPSEKAENARFDPQRFRALGQEKEPFRKEDFPEMELPHRDLSLSAMQDGEIYSQAPLTELHEPSAAKPQLQQLHASSSQEEEVSRTLKGAKTAYREISSSPPGGNTPVEHRSPPEAVLPDSSPLTAEDVSQAFRRDDRRYDSGFPLY